MLDSQPWKATETSARLPFHLDGDAVPASTTSARRSWISAAEGVVTRVEASTLWVAGDTVVSLQHCVPRSFDLTPLAGRRVRLALLHVSSLDAGLAQTLTIAGAGGDPLLIAHAGEARGIAHALGKLNVYVALSQRQGGPMVFGTARLQSIVRAGDHIRVSRERDTYVMQFESRSGRDATYAIGAEELWRGPPSTKR